MKMLIALLLAANVGVTEPGLTRQPRVAAWTTDLTARLVAVDAPATQLPVGDQAQTMVHYLDRPALCARSPIGGESQHWAVSVTLPEGAPGDWPVVVEADESRVITDAWFDGQPLGTFDRGAFSQFYGGEGSLLLPLSGQRRSGVLTIKVVRLTHLYDNGFGGLRLRPATASEVVRIERFAAPAWQWNERPAIDGGHASGQVPLVNRSSLPIRGTLHVRHENFFGENRGTFDQNVELAANSRGKYPLPAPNAEDVYKTRAFFSVGPYVTFDHWQLTNPDCENRQREEVAQLRGPWEFTWSAAQSGLGDNVPASGWAKVKLPHAPGGNAHVSHWGWYRTTLNVPAAWRGRRLHLFLSDVRQHATVFVDGKRVDARAVWELPGTIDLTDVVQPGVDYELAIGVSDHVVALREGLAIPTRGNDGLPGRALAAPVDQAFGLRQAPELLAVPAVRCDWAGIRTQTVGGLNADVRMELRNDTATPASVRPTVSILDRGTAIASSTAAPVTLQPHSMVELTVTLAPPAEAVRLWDTEQPALYEMRVELVNENGQRLDIRRERFGFRQFDLVGDHFTLNGQRINILGGSHVVLDNELWPLRPTPYRIVRHFFQSPTGFCSGRVQANLADEIGVLVKQEHPQHNAMHADRYAYHLPVMWQRTLENMKQNIRLLTNHPATIIWDIGNELHFAGTDEMERMCKLLKDVQTLDPTRFATQGGGHPALSDAAVYDWHGWGVWSRRDDYFLQHPEHRPSYYSNSGLFAHVPANEDPTEWTIVKTKLPAFGFPADGRGDDLTGKRLALDGRPIIFTEGHYYENRPSIELAGVDTYVPVPVDPQWKWGWDQSPHWLNWLAARRLSLANVRQAEHALSMIHVDRGVGRGIYPLAAFSFDRATRFESGQPVQDCWTIHQDLTGTHRVHATWRLLDGERQLDVASFEQVMPRGQVATVNLILKAPAVAADRSLRLLVEVTADGYDGVFRDEVPITIFAPVKLAVPGNVTLDLWDPQGQVASVLSQDHVAFNRLATLDNFKGEAGHVLLAASDSLQQATAAQRATLGRTIAAGGIAVILDHRDIPSFLAVPPQTRPGATSMAATIDSFSPLTAQLTRRDFMFWRTCQRDQLVVWNELDRPSSGSIRAHLATTKGSPLLEVTSGSGRVLFCQLNLRDALGHEPAARRVLANLLRWTAVARPVPADNELRTLVISQDQALISMLQQRMGLQAQVKASLQRGDLAGRSLIVISGAQSSTRQVLDPNLAELQAALQRGATLFVQDLDDAGADWLSRLTDSPIQRRPLAMDVAYLRPGHPLLAGLTHGDVLWSNVPMRDRTRGLTPAQDQIGHYVVEGSAVTPLLDPSYLVVIGVGHGQVVINNTRCLDRPTPAAARLLAGLLTNCGANLVQGGIHSMANNEGQWSFKPVDLRPFMNWPIADEPGRRGFHGGGPENDLRHLPRGNVELLGVTYSFVNPDELGGNGCIAVAATKDVGVLPQEVRDIPLNCKADRLYFLHNSAWGVPQFTYRIYYQDDLRDWIPGKPDPFVDVVVKPNETIDDWYFAGMIARGERYLPNAKVAWKGQTPMSRRQGQEVGLYQQIWDNPHPEKTIAKIDILSPGKVGGGQAFIFAMTVAERQDAVAASQRPLPKDVKEDSFVQRVSMPRYELLLSANGVVRLFAPDGSPIANTDLYYQGQVKDESGKTKSFEFLENLDGKKFKIERKDQEDGSVLLELIDQAMIHMNFTQIIVCRPSRVEFDQKFVITKESRTGPNSNLMTRFVFAKDLLTDEDFGKPNQQSVPFQTRLGILTIELDPSIPLKWYRNYVMSKSGLNGQPLGDMEIKTGQEAVWKWAVILP